MPVATKAQRRKWGIEDRVYYPVGYRSEWRHCPLGENTLEKLTDKQFAASLDAWRRLSSPFDGIDANWCIRYLNEAERRWRP